LPTTPIKPFTLPANSLTKAIAQEKRRLYAPMMDKSLQEDTGAHMKETCEFIQNNLSGAFKDLHAEESDPTVRGLKIMRSIISVKPLTEVAKAALAKLPADQKEAYQAVMKSAMNLHYRWVDTYRQIARNQKAFVEMIRSNITAYLQEINSLKLDPNASEIEIKHPENIRVIAASSQNGGSSSPIGDETLSWGTNTFVNALQQTDSLDNAIDHAEQHYLLREGDGPETIPDDLDKPPVGAHFEKPIATNRHNPVAWKKADNTNPNVKRIAIVISTGDGNGHARVEADTVASQFAVQSAADFAAQPQAAAYRVDKLIRITPPTPEETAKGITQTDKIKQAFANAETFVAAQKQAAREQALATGNNPDAAEQALQFDGFASWHGHGMTVQDKGPAQDDDRRYLEGSKEFFFITQHASGPNGHPAGVDETTIKTMEHKHLSNFRYFVHNIHACASAAAIA
jgi:hypothetical protein